MQYADFTRELQVPTSCPLLGVTPFRIVAVHHWKYKDTSYSNFIQDPDIIESRQPTRIQILRSNRSLPLAPLSKFHYSVLIGCNLDDFHIRKKICSSCFQSIIVAKKRFYVLMVVEKVVQICRRLSGFKLWQVIYENGITSKSIF